MNGAQSIATPASPARAALETERSARGRWLRRHAAGLALAAAALLLVFETTPLDVRLAALFYDPVAAGFTLRHALWAESLYHASKAAALLAGGLGFAYASWRTAVPGAGWPRRNALAAALGTALVPLGVVLLKQAMQRHCPWSMEAFGGVVPYTRLWEALPAGIGPGRCFPAGHAAGGFLWLVWGVLLRRAHPRLARWALWGGLASGAAMGLLRMSQGAHFLSHTLWTAWFAWAVTIVLVALCAADVRAPAERARAAPAAA